MIKKLEEDLKQNISGDVRFDKISRKVYSVDASIYEIEPIGIVLPKNLSDLKIAVEIAHTHSVPIIPRGAATGITGGCLGVGLIIDTSKYLNHILEVNFEEEFVVCEPGVVQDQLNLALSSRDYRLGPDTSTGNRATLGGMLANNSAGARSLRYGKMVDHINSVELLLSSGEIIYFHPCDEITWKKKLTYQTNEGLIYRTIDQIRKEKRHEIEKAFPNIPRRVSGYNLDELIKDAPLNICKIIAGSEGTLGIASKIKLKICQRPKITGLCLIHFNQMLEGMNVIEQILEFRPLSLEMIDRQILTMGKLSPIIQKKIQWLQGDPEAVFIVEFEGGTPDEVMKMLADFSIQMQQKGIGYAWVPLVDRKEMENVWATRKAGLSLLLSKRSYSRAIAFIEDLSIPVRKLPLFIQVFQQYLKKVDKQAGIYGHVGSGCMHIRPYIDLRKPEEMQLMEKMLNDISDLVLELGGALSGEHGDGLIRTWLNKKMFGEKVYQAFQEVKNAFDPEHMMNPGKVVEGPKLLENLRLNPEIKQTSIKTFLDFSAEGGFELSVDLCNGNGLCRKKDHLMCPSFQVSQDEYDTTRARAQALRSIVNGRLPIEEFSSAGIQDVLDLCIECKGCKTECPSGVDMAKMKAEMLYHYQEKHGYSLRNLAFGHIGTIYEAFSPYTSLFNSVQKMKWTKWLLSLVGISSKRPLPMLSKQRFSHWLKQKVFSDSSKKVVLFNDTYTEFLCPEIGQAAMNILTGLGYQVIVLPWSCCGRTFISKGMLKQARSKAKNLVEALLPYALQGIPILGLEPSCILTIKDDFPSLLGVSSQDVLQVASHCLTIDEFLFQLIEEDAFCLPFSNQSKIVKFHGHCHQKSLVGTEVSLSVLRAIAGIEVSEIKSGCCGLAGSFGYEKEHEDFSLKIGELVLFPSVRSSPDQTTFIANGFSCRNQIFHGTAQRAKHLVEFISECCF